MSDQKHLRVLDALRRGAETSREISDDTGMPVEIVSAYLCFLEKKKGLAQRVGIFHHHDSRRSFIRWRAVA